MAVETLAGAFASVVGATHGLAGTVKAAVGVYDFGVVVIEDGDIRTMCKLPARSLVIGGWMWAGDLDTGVETVDIDIGWAANGAGSVTYTDTASGVEYTNAAASASATGFVNSGVLTGDGVLDLYAAGNNYRPFPLITGPLYFAEATQVQAEVNAPSATPASAKMYIVLLYTCV